MNRIDQVLVPGIVGMSTYVDAVYLMEVQRAAVADADSAARPLHRLRTVMAKMDYELFVVSSESGRPDEVEEQIADAAVVLEAAGADFLVVTSGTGNLLTTRARERASLPVLDLERASWAEVVARDHETVGVLSMRHAAASGMYGALAEADGVTLQIPPADTGARIDDLIYRQLAYGEVPRSGVDLLVGAIAELAKCGAQAVLVGNTSMTLMHEQLVEASPLPLIDAARAHARAAGRAALSGVLADATRP